MRAHRVLLLAAAFAVACSSKARPDASKGPASRPSVPAGNESAAPTEPSSAPPETPPAPAAFGGPGVAHPSPDLMQDVKACRALTVKGTIKAESGRALRSGDSLDAPTWLDLAPGAQLAVKNAGTTREVVITGPARVLPCDHGEERFLLAKGRAITAVQAGARPGAEVLIATPVAVVRYGDAALDIRVDAKTLRVASAKGEAFIDRGQADGGEHLMERGHTEVPIGAVDVKGLVAECDAASRASESLAREVIAPKVPSPLGERAAAHVRGRRSARMKCGIAAASLGTMEMGPERDSMGKLVGESEARWRGVPSGKADAP